MTPSTPASTLTDDQIDEAQSECDAFLCDNCDIRIHEFAREIEHLVRSTPAAVEVSEPTDDQIIHAMTGNFRWSETPDERDAISFARDILALSRTPGAAE